MFMGDEEKDSPQGNIDSPETKPMKINHPKLLKGNDDTKVLSKIKAEDTAGPSSEGDDVDTQEIIRLQQIQRSDAFNSEQQQILKNLTSRFEALSEHLLDSDQAHERVDSQKKEVNKTFESF